MQDVVADLALAPDAYQLPALGLDRRLAQAPREFAIALGRRRISEGALDFVGELGAHARGQLGRHALALSEFVDSGQRRGAQCHARMLVLIVQAPVRPDFQPAYQRWQAQALHHQCHRDHHESQENNQVALRKRLAVREHDGQREGRGQRHDPAHAAPAHNEHLAFGGRGFALAQRRTQHARQVRRRVNPCKAHRDGDDADQHAIQAQLRRRISGQPCDGLRKLDADQHEDQAVQQKHQHIPHRARDDAHFRRYYFRGVAPAHHARRDHREHAGDMH